MNSLLPQVLLGYCFFFLIGWYDFNIIFIVFTVNNVTAIIEYLPQLIVFRAPALFFLHFDHTALRDLDIMPGIDEGGRPSTVTSENTVMTRSIACLRRICEDYADILVPDTQSDTRSVSLLAIENIVLSILLTPRRRARSTAFVDAFIEFMDQVHVFQTFVPDFEPFIVRTCRAEMRIVVNQIFTMPQGTVPVVAPETLVLIPLPISDSNIRNELIDS